MTKRKSTTLPLGVISEGTLRPEDLIFAYLDTLAGIRLTKTERAEVVQLRKEAQALIDAPEDDDTSIGLPEIASELAEILSNHCPDYAYFGSLEGDGACFGVWPSMDQLEDDARFDDGPVLKVDAGVFPPTAFRKVDRKNPMGQAISHLMSVTDHGNVTLYRRSGQRWIEVWKVV